MRVVRNTGYLKRRQRGARVMTLGGVIGLGSAIVMTFQPDLILLAYAVLIFGFIFFNAGMQQVTLWNRSPRSDEVLDQLLRRLNDRYTLIHFPEISGMRPMHVLVYPAGLLVITTRILAGQFVVDGDRWRQLGRRFLRMFLFSGPQLGNPTIENQRQQEALRSFMEEMDLPGRDMVDGLIVFLNPRAVLEVKNSPITVVDRDDLLKAVRSFGTEALLTAKERDELVEALSRGDNVEGPVSLPARDPRGRGEHAA